MARHKMTAPVAAAAAIGLAFGIACGSSAAPTKPATSGSPVTPAATTAAGTSLVQQAQQEKELDLYITGSTAKEMQTYFFPPFHAKYPFIKINLTRGSGTSVTQRFETEEHAGKHIADVVSLNQFKMYEVVQQHLIQPYDSPERSAYPADRKDSQGLYTAYRIQGYAIGYNTNLVKNPPTSWEDVLNPRYRGLIAVEQDLANAYAASYDAWGKAKADPYWQSFARQKPLVLTGKSQMTAQLASGQVGITMFQLIHEVVGPLGLARKGAPVAFVHVNPVFGDVSDVAISKNAPHPAAAKLWVNWLLSTEGQDAIAKSGRIPARPGIAVDSVLVKGLTFHIVPISIAPSFNQWQDRWRSLLSTAQKG